MTAVARAAQPKDDKALPSVDRLLGSEAFLPLIARFGRQEVLAATRALLDRERKALASRETSSDGSPEVLATRAALDLELAFRTSLSTCVQPDRHGAAHQPRPRAAAGGGGRAVADGDTGPCNLEYDLAPGGAWRPRRPGRRRSLSRAHRRRGRHVVNNNAAAVLLALNTLARGKEVIVSRGELIEIGGAFRMPDIMARAGCKLRRGGHHQSHPPRGLRRGHRRRAPALHHEGPHQQLRDRGIHRRGAPRPSSARLRTRAGLPLMVDLGSGALVDLSRYGLPREPTPRETLGARRRPGDLQRRQAARRAAGGDHRRPQGPRRRIKKKPAQARAARGQDDARRARGGARLYRDPDRLAERLPTLRLLTRPAGDIARHGRPPAASPGACVRRARRRDGRATAQARSAAARCRWSGCPAPRSRCGLPAQARRRAAARAAGGRVARAAGARDRAHRTTARCGSICAASRMRRES